MFVNSAVIQETNFAVSTINDEIIRKLESHAANSINFLNAVLQLNDLQPKVLSLDTFQMLTENSTEIKQNWDNVYNITENELKCQVRFIIYCE
jgi:integrator complex subunit 8